MSIADTAVLVTGANRGLGRALVEEALSRGAKRVYAGTVTSCATIAAELMGDITQWPAATEALKLLFEMSTAWEG